MISALQWVRRGAAQARPDKYDLDEKEFKRINDYTAQHLADAKEELDAAKKAERVANGMEVETIKETNPELSEYNLDDYDEEKPEGQEATIFSNLKGLTYYTSNREDPYITLRDEEDEDEEDVLIQPTDNLLLAAKTEDDISHLEVYLYDESEENEGNMYVHHDIMLPAFPLCLEWLDFRVGRKSSMQTPGNYVAVGTFDPEIEIWDLDTIDNMYPDAVLGAQDKSKKKKGAKKSKKPNNEYHTDAVLALAWNKQHRNILASASADTTVKLWDLTTQQCAHSFSHHTDKVQALAWNPVESTAMATGSYDKTVVVFDSRAPDARATWKLQADVECLRWDPHDAQCFYVSTDDGMVQYFDARQSGAQPVFRLHAHDKAVSALDINTTVRGCIVTGSTDGSVKVWDVNENRPSMVTSRNVKSDIGQVFSVTFCPDAPFNLAMAGSAGKVNIWDIATNAGVRRAFEGRSTIVANRNAEKEKVVAMPSDDEPESEEEMDGADIDMDDVAESDFEEEESGEDV
ncbi:WD40-repeat-containing domain protein [Gamsiella multidivaricata]|uniref:WD40-repeat-containing domain protein n=1 Tax=Gamsiella multidivaricata TaxID=101098 RepID=UPI0022204494|nr:WD40-repeat-containing domain protein [Gamsiella multidivaricata]KAG0367274.1 hypothetical protein BGZ54_004133 [Gamsiella multidivaricata]KAI7823860.1 WD40-repeat-containing domain protein [Gamsiella multidivaricata]